MLLKRQPYWIATLRLSSLLPTFPPEIQTWNSDDKVGSELRESKFQVIKEVAIKTAWELFFVPFFHFAKPLSGLSSLSFIHFRTLLWRDYREKTQKQVPWSVSHVGIFSKIYIQICCSYIPCHCLDALRKQCSSQKSEEAISSAESDLLITQLTKEWGQKTRSLFILLTIVREITLSWIFLIHQS